jgi:hypothetical protein
VDICGFVKPAIKFFKNFSFCNTSLYRQEREFIISFFRLLLLPFETGFSARYLSTGFFYICHPLYTAQLDAINKSENLSIFSGAKGRIK